MHKDINFFSIYRSQLDSDSGKDPVTIAGIVIVSVCLVVVLGLFGAFRFLSAGIALQNNRISAFLASPQVKTAQSKVAAEGKKITAFNNYTRAVNGAYKLYSALPGSSSAAFLSVQADLPADVTIVTASYAADTLTMQCTSTNQLSGANFAHALRQNPAVLRAVYNGVSFQNNTYNFTVSCTVKEAAGK